MHPDQGPPAHRRRVGAISHSDQEGIHCENPRLDYPKVKDRKDGIVNKHAKGVEFLLKRAKVERIAGFATLKGGGKVEVKSDSGVQTLEAKNIIIATGSEARMIPGLEPDAEFILTNIEILNLTAVPKTPGDHRGRRGRAWNSRRFSNGSGRM